MPSFTANTKDMQFVLHDLLKISEQDIPGFSELDRDFTGAVLEEAGKISNEVLAPLNVVGDTEGCVLENGVVRTSPGFADGFKAVADGGWIGMSADPEYGGMGLPLTLQNAVNDMMASSCLSLQRIQTFLDRKQYP